MNTSKEYTLTYTGGCNYEDNWPESFAQGNFSPSKSTQEIK